MRQNMSKKQKLPPTRSRKKVVKPWIGAKLIDANGQLMRFFRAPVNLKGNLEGTAIPELHTVVRLRGGEAAVLVSTQPVTYKWSGKAPLIQE